MVQASLKIVYLAICQALNIYYSFLTLLLQNNFVTLIIFLTFIYSLYLIIQSKFRIKCITDAVHIIA